MFLTWYKSFVPLLFVRLMNIDESCHGCGCCPGSCKDSCRNSCPSDWRPRPPLQLLPCTTTIHSVGDHRGPCGARSAGSTLAKVSKCCCWNANHRMKFPDFRVRPLPPFCERLSHHLGDIAGMFACFFTFVARAGLRLPSPAIMPSP